MGKKFNLIHWWYLLRDQPKWESACDQSIEASLKRLRINELGGHSNTSSPKTRRTPSTLGTPINLDSDDTPTNEVGGIIQPMGRKVVNRKDKAQVEDPMVEVTMKELLILGLSLIHI